MSDPWKQVIETHFSTGSSKHRQQTYDPTSPASRLTDALHHHVEHLNALHDLLTNLSPYAVELDDPSRAVRSALRKQFSSPEEDKSDPATEGRVKAALTFFAELFAAGERGVGTVQFRHQPPTSPARAELQWKADELVTAWDNDLASVVTLTSRFLMLGYRADRADVFVRSLIVSAVSAFEQLMARLLTALYATHPKAISSDELRFSLADLKRFTSIEAAFEAAVAMRVDADMRGSVDDWKDRVLRQTRLDLSAEVEDWEAVREAYERRNVIVHNDCRVSEQYLSKIPKARDWYEAGQPITSDDEYALGVLDAVLSCGLIATILVWMKLDKDTGPSAGHLARTLTYELMDQGRWPAVRAICSSMKASVFGDEMGRLVFQANEWLARKRLRTCFTMT